MASLSIPRLVVERSYDILNEKAADSALTFDWATAYAGGVNMDAGHTGILPGALLAVDSSDTEGKLKIADGTSKLSLLGMAFNFLPTGTELGHFSNPGYTPAGDYPQGGQYLFKFSETDGIGVVPVETAIAIVSLYAAKTDAGVAQTYAQGDLLYRSKYGVITKDKTTAAAALEPELGQVLDVQADGNLRIQLFRGKVAA